MSNHRDAAAAPPAGSRDEEDAVPRAGVQWEEEEEEDGEVMSGVKVGDCCGVLLHAAWSSTLIGTIVVVLLPTRGSLCRLFRVSLLHTADLT